MVLGEFFCFSVKITKIGKVLLIVHEMRLEHQDEDIK